MLQFPGFVTMIVGPGGATRPAAVLRLADRTPALPVFLSAEQARDPDPETLHIRARATTELHDWPLRDILDACAMAHLVRTSVKEDRFSYLWGYESVRKPGLKVDLEELYADEAAACERPVAMDQMVIEEMRNHAWDNEVAPHDSSAVTSAFRREIDRFRLYMVAVRSVRQIMEQLVVAYRGTPRPLTMEDREAIFEACYIDAGVSEGDVSGPFQIDSAGIHSMWRRTVPIGPISSA